MTTTHLSAQDRPVVLVVDDDESYRRSAHLFFAELGCEVCSAGAVKSSMELVYKHLHEYMIALIDWKLIGATGLELLKRFREVAEHRMVSYIVTGGDVEVIEAQAREAGALEVYQKSPKLWAKLAFLVNPETNAVLELLKTSSEDDLTGLWNRRVFQQKFLIKQQEVFQNRRHLAKRCLLFIDVDDFKVINDNHSHQMGDRVLQKVAEVIRSSVRDGDHIFRWGGDEFLVLLPDTEEKRAEGIAETLKAVASRTQIIDETDNSVVSPALSVGLGAMYGDEAEHFPDPTAELLRRADNACQQEKKLKGAGR